MLKVTRSGYYAWAKAGCAKKGNKDEKYLEMIRKIEMENNEVCGVRRVYKELRKSMPCSRSKVQRIMHENGIKAKIETKYKPQTTKSDPNAQVFENLLNQDFTATQPNQVWLSDITYIRVGFRWVYLAAVLDLGTRKIVGWELSFHPDANLACAALQKAVRQNRPGKGLIHHSDRGCQYTSQKYRDLIAKYSMVGSMSRKGNPYDNAPMESFFKTLKTEWVYKKRYITMSQAAQSLVYYIDYYYNCKRLHSSLGYETPRKYALQSKPAV